MVSRAAVVDAARRFMQAPATRSPAAPASGKVGDVLPAPAVPRRLFAA
jgi:hypothetical protein